MPDVEEGLHVALLPHTETVAIKDWDHFYNHCRRNLPGTWMFRGQANSKWNLLSPLERFVAYYMTGRESFDSAGDVTPDALAFLAGVMEEDVLLNFRKRAPLFVNYRPQRDNSLEWLAILQHHGSPTRLLDWTFSPFVAAFFSVEDRPVSPVVWCVNWFMLWNAVRWKLGTLQDPDSTMLVQASRRTNLGFDAKWIRQISDVLVCRVRDLKNYDRDVVVPFVPPSHAFERLLSQQGAFLVPLSLKQSFPEVLGNTFDGVRHEEMYADVTDVGIGMKPLQKPLQKLILPTGVANRRLFLQELKRMNITHATLFPGLDGLAKSLLLDAAFVE